MPTELLYTIDRIEGKTAVLVDETGHRLSIPTNRLPPGGEGKVLRVPINRSGTPQWGEARVDRAETERRLREAKKLLEELKQRDPGDNVEL